MRNASLIIPVTLAVALALGSLASCVSAPVIAKSHPASAEAPAGRLAGVAPSLRNGVVSYPDVPEVRAAPPPDHSHHQHEP